MIKLVRAKYLNFHELIEGKKTFDYQASLTFSPVRVAANLESAFKRLTDLGV